MSSLRTAGLQPLWLPTRVLATAYIALGLFGCAGALASALSDETPKGVNLSGSWRLDVQRSDDAQAALANLRKVLDAQKPLRGGSARGPRRADGNAAEEDRGDRLFRDLAMDAQREQRTRQMERYTELLRNPPRIDIEQGEDSINIVAGYDRLECVPGEVVSVTDSAGTGRRNCGWNGQALLIVQKGQRGSVQERRYEFGAGGAELIYTTTLNAEKLPEIKLRRIYHRDGFSVAAPPTGAAASPKH